MEGFRRLAAYRGLPALVEPGYELEEFLKAVAVDPQKRCAECYRIRLSRTAAKAKELGFELFGTTLLISPLSEPELICETGHGLAARYGLRFYDADFRPVFVRKPKYRKELELYRQKYCGCIYSEKERYYREGR